MAASFGRNLVLTALSLFSAFAPLLAQGPPDDVIPPNLLSINPPTGTIDARAQSQTAALTAVALDPAPGGVASGVSYAFVEFSTPSCAQPAGSLYAYIYPSGTFVPGQNQDLSGSVSVYPTSVSGTYYSCYAYTIDNVGNTQYYSLYNGLTSSLLQSLPTFSVITSPPPPLPPPPVLTSFSLSPNSADVTSSSQTFNVSLTATDSGPGISPSYSYANLCTTSPAQVSYCWYTSQMSLQPGGTSANGTYAGQIKIPRYSMPGTWMASVGLCDTGDNCKYYQPSDLQKANFPYSVILTDATPDTVGPQLKSITFMQNGFTSSNDLVFPATSATTQNPIAVSLEFNDSFSGVLGYDGYSGCNPFMYVTSQDQFPNGSSENTTQQQYAGFTQDTSAPSRFIGVLNLPYLSEIGTWTVYLQTCDRVGNYSTFTGPTSQLGPVGAFLYVLYSTPATPPVTIPPANPPITVSDPSGATLSVPGGAAIITGSITPVTNPTVSIIVTPPPPDPNSPSCNPTVCAAPPIAQGFATTGSSYVSIIFSYPGGDPVPNASLAPPGATITIPNVVPPGNPDDVMASALKLWSIENGQSAKAIGCSGTSVIATLDAATGSVKYSNVCNFSTFYVLKQIGIPGDLNNDGVVNCVDIGLVKASFGKKTGQVGFNASADVNADGVVNILDLSFVSKQLSPGTVCQ